MLLHLRTWAEVEAHLRDHDGIIIPIGSTEQHGPNGMIGTDAICAEAVAHRVGEITGAMVGPTLPVGMAVHHMAFAGSMTLRPTTLIALLTDCVTSLAHHGFRRFLFVNGHGGNVATMAAAFSEVHFQRHQAGLAPLRFTVANWWEDSSIGALSREFYGDKEGSHATPSEVSLVQHVHPAALRPDIVVDPPVAPKGSFQGPDDFRLRFPDGRIGSAPGLSRPEHGARLLEAAAQSIAKRYTAFNDADR